MKTTDKDLDRKLKDDHPAMCDHGKCDFQARVETGAKIRLCSHHWVRELCSRLEKLHRAIDDMESSYGCRHSLYHQLNDELAETEKRYTKLTE